MSKRYNRDRHTNLSRGVDDLPVTPNPHWGGFQESTAPLSRTLLILSWLESRNHSTPWFHYSSFSPLRWGEHKTSYNQNRGSSTISLEVLHEIHFSKPSRERQLPRVTSWWRLLEVSLMPQSSNSWCNALGSSHTLKNAISKQVCVREGCLSSNVSRMLSKWPRETPNGRALCIYRHPFKN